MIEYCAIPLPLQRTVRSQIPKWFNSRQEILVFHLLNAFILNLYQVVVTDNIWNSELTDFVAKGNNIELTSNQITTYISDQMRGRNLLGIGEETLAPWLI